MLRRDFLVVDIRVRNIDLGKPIKEADQLVRMLIGESERRHPKFQPGTNWHRRLQEAEEPVGLNLFTFTIEYRRCQCRILLIVLSDIAAAFLDLMTAYTIV